MKFNWEGIFPALTTKFTANGNLDLEMLEKHIHAQREAGIHGLILGGSLGEASTLYEEEKMILVKKAREVVKNKIPVILTIAEQSTMEAIAQAKKAEENGANGLMILPPMRYQATDDETVEFFKAIASRTKLPIMVYNNPIDYKILITLDMFESLSECENIQAIKDSTRDVTNVTRMINRFGDRFKVFTGVDPLALESLLMGAHGWVAGLVCAFPHETMAIYNFVKAKKYAEALDLYRWFLPLLELDVSPQLVQNIKLAEFSVGLGTEHVRPPRLPLHGKHRERVMNIINKVLASRPKLPDSRNFELIEK